MKKKLILASGSPRRTELLAQIELKHTVVLARVEETTTSDDPAEVVEELSRQKCRDVAARIEGAAVILGADTVVSLEGRILGKPASVGEAEEMLRSLAGRAHEVFTGVTLIEKDENRQLRERTFHERTEVHVLPMTEAEIRWYVETQEPLDKAGAYGAQGPFARFIDRFCGDYFNVIGLPVHAVYQQLKEWNLMD